jgi:hypothetical protein
LDGGSACRKVATYTQNKRTQTSMPGVGFEPTIPVFEREKTVHVLDQTATVIAMTTLYEINLFEYYCKRCRGFLQPLKKVPQIHGRLFHIFTNSLSIIILTLHDVWSNLLTVPLNIP